MSKRLKMFLMVAVAGGVIGTASMAEAGNNIRNSVERRLNPGNGFWGNSPSVNTYQSRSSQRSWMPFQFFNSNNSYRPATRSNSKSWGWQRSSRAEFHHPGPRRR